MGIFIAKRIALMLPTLLGVAVITFLMLRVIPGDIVQVRLLADGGNVSEAALEAERKRLGLDGTLPEQFVSYFHGLVRGDLGNSMWSGAPVVEEISSRFPLTLQVAIMATMLAVIVAVPLGTLSALRNGTVVDYAIRFFTMAGLALPGFWVGLLLLLALLRYAGWLPPIMFTPLWEDPWANLSQLIWPALVVGFRFASVLARLIRSSLLDALNEDYIRTARAKGVPERRVVWLHALKNAALPAITVIGLEFALMIGGLVVTEQVFNLNGLGKLFVDSVMHKDFTMIQGMVLLFAVMYMLVNIIVDLIFAAVDPRIRYR